ncbi:MAG: S1 RNA-binding domain-containing protein [Erysipelotrichaceae bacterium]|nr:S1 RNA-binding domain-containing protein [Erysipelotrichaceae bacterium]
MTSINDYKIGMTVYGKITNLKPYGAFVSFENGVSGLIHISELSNGFVKDVNNYVKVDEHVMLKVIDIDVPHKQLRLSFKALSQNNRKYMKRVKYLGLPKNEIGFSSLSNAMNRWVKEKENAES